MNDLLLDTHVLIWLLQDDVRMAESAFVMIRSAAAVKKIIVSAITPWEISLLVAKKRIDLGLDFQFWIDQAIGLPVICLQALTPAIAVESTRLPLEMRPDPADRILVATARHFGATLMTADSALLRHGAVGRFRCVSAI